MKSKDKFAEEVAEVMNEELLQYENGSPVIEKGRCPGCFIDADGEIITSEEIIMWFNILCHDEEYLNDDMITNKMFQKRREGVKLGYITDETPTTW